MHNQIKHPIADITEGVSETYKAYLTTEQLQKLSKLTFADVEFVVTVLGSFIESINETEDKDCSLKDALMEGMNRRRKTAVSYETDFQKNCREEGLQKVFDDSFKVKHSVAIFNHLQPHCTDDKTEITMGRRFQLIVPASFSILDVKKKIQDQEGIHVDEQKLSFAGTHRVDDDSLVKDIPLKHKDTLILRVCPKDGQTVLLSMVN